MKKKNWKVIVFFWFSLVDCALKSTLMPTFYCPILLTVDIRQKRGGRGEKVREKKIPRVCIPDFVHGLMEDYFLTAY